MSASNEQRNAIRAHRRGNRWELFTCARRGHVTYAPDEAALAARLSGKTGLGEVWRCLRCGDFVIGAPHGRGRADHAPLALRGAALRQGPRNVDAFTELVATRVEKSKGKMSVKRMLPDRPGRRLSGLRS